jgi:predicted chitinase
MSDISNTYKVDASALNLRTHPRITENTLIATMPNGHKVRKVGSAEEEGWMMVSTELDGESLTGFAGERFLVPVQELNETETQHNVTYQVDATALNLRSKPHVRANTRMATLPNGHKVNLVGSSEREGWVMVSTEVDGKSLTGFVGERFLLPVNDFDEPETHLGVTEVHLPEDDPRARRDVDGRRALPLGETGRPTRDPEGSREEKRTSLAGILNWLDVENSVRYLASGRRTFCNIYAHDYCYLANVYLPRVWWRDRALMRLEAGKPVRPLYDKTLRELNANSLFDWLKEWGADFGWEHVFNPGELQDAVNDGGVGVIVAKRTELNRPGHISVVVPETGEHTAFRRNGEVTRPLQSQAGRKNFKYGTTHWWTHQRFRDFAFWVVPGESTGTDGLADVQRREDTVSGVITESALRRVYPASNVTSQQLETIAEELSRNLERGSIDTELRLAHFMAQIRHETGPDLHLEENLNYSAEALKKVFAYYRRNPVQADLHGRKDDQSADQEAIANHAYANRIGNGGANSGDGWRYRGRGMIQLTGRDNYAVFTNAHQKIWEEYIDFVNNPELLTEEVYAVRSSLEYWLRRELYKIADRGDDRSVTDQITNGINPGIDDNSREQRHANLRSIIDNGIFNSLV